MIVYSAQEMNQPLMKKLLTCALLIAGAATLGLAQPKKGDATGIDAMTKNAASPAKETTVTINGKKIGIWYHAPSVKGRKIFGSADALQPEGSIWRLGADNATWLHTDADLDINGVKVAPGDYSLYVDLDAGKWKLIVNKKTGQWGINRDGSTTRVAADDVGTAAMTMSKPASPVEQLKIALSPAGGNKGKLQVDWENVSASVDFTAK
jgi:hypothetical protein